MKRVLYNNLEHILAREHSSNLELVDVSTCTTLFVPKGSEMKESHNARECSKSTVPGNIEFPQRSRDFVTELQNRRLEFLKEARENKRRTSGPRKGTDPNNGTDRKRAGRAKKTKIDPLALMQQMMEEKVKSLGKK